MIRWALVPATQSTRLPFAADDDGRPAFASEVEEEEEEGALTGLSSRLIVSGALSVQRVQRATPRILSSFSFRRIASDFCGARHNVQFDLATHESQAALPHQHFRVHKSCPRLVVRPLSAGGQLTNRFCIRRIRPARLDIRRHVGGRYHTDQMSQRSSFLPRVGPCKSHEESLKEI